MNARQFAIAALDRGLSRIMAHAPNAVADRLAAFVGQKLGPRLYPRAVANLRVALERLQPGQDTRALQAINIDNAARSMMEVVRLGRIQAEGRIRVHGAEHLAPGPVVVAALHLGNWETIAPALWQSGVALTGIYESLPDAFRAKQALRARAPFCHRAIAGSPAATRWLVRALEDEKGVVLMYMDELRAGVPNAPAFGRPLASGGNIRTIARLAQRAGAGVVLAYAERRPGPYFDVHFCPPITMPADLTEAVAMLDAAAEIVVRPRLAQWLFLPYCR